MISASCPHGRGEPRATPPRAHARAAPKPECRRARQELVGHLSGWPDRAHGQDEAVGPGFMLRLSVYGTCTTVPSGTRVGRFATTGPHEYRQFVTGVRAHPSTGVGLSVTHRGHYSTRQHDPLIGRRRAPSLWQTRRGGEACMPSRRVVITCCLAAMVCTAAPLHAGDPPPSLVSVAPNGAVGNGPSDSPSVNATATCVAFQSAASEPGG